MYVTFRYGMCVHCFPISIYSFQNTSYPIYNNIMLADALLYRSHSKLILANRKPFILGKLTSCHTKPSIHHSYIYIYHTCATSFHKTGAAQVPRVRALKISDNLIEKHFPN